MRHPLALVPLLGCLAFLSACGGTPSSEGPATLSGSDTPAHEDAPAPSTASSNTTPIDIASSMLISVNTTETRAEPWPLASGQALAASIITPQAGQLVGVDVHVGTYGNTSDGALKVRACQAGTCAEGSAELASGKDNKFLTLPLSTRLALDVAQPLELTISREGGANDFALWVLPAKLDAPTAADQLPAKVPNVGLRYESND
jgi:hypothetical protein